MCSAVAKHQPRALRMNVDISNARRGGVVGCVGAGQPWARLRALLRFMARLSSSLIPPQTP